MRIKLKLFFTIWIVYAVYATPAGGSQPNRYMDLLHSIVNQGRFEIDSYHDNTVDKAYFNGHYYTAALPGPSIMAVPIYVVIRQFYNLAPQSIVDQAGGIQSFKKSKSGNLGFYGTIDNVEFFLSQFVLTLTFIGGLGAASATIVYSLARRLGAGTPISILTAIAYAWGTNAFFFSTTFFEQIVTASLGIISFFVIFLLVERRKFDWKPLMAAGCLAGLLMLIEFSGAGLVLLFFLYLLYYVRDLRVIAFVIGVAIPISVLLSYNYAIFGNALDSPYLHLGSEFDYQIKEGFVGLSYPRIDRAVGVLFGLEKGLFVYSPVLVFSFLGIVTNLAKKPYHALAWLVTIIFALFLTYNASFCCWNVTSFGPKYFVSVLPFLALPIALVDWNNKFLRTIFGVTLVASILINWMGAQFGFADSVLQHARTVQSQGPTLPILWAILSHTSGLTPLTAFVTRFHAVITLGVNLTLLGGFAWIWREVWAPAWAGQWRRL